MRKKKQIKSTLTHVEYSVWPFAWHHREGIQSDFIKRWTKKTKKSQSQSKIFLLDRFHDTTLIVLSVIPSNVRKRKQNENTHRFKKFWVTVSTTSGWLNLNCFHQTWERKKKEWTFINLKMSFWSFLWRHHI